MDNLYVGNVGYCIIGKQTDKDTAVTPSIAIPITQENLTTNANKHLQATIKGNRNQYQDVNVGQRSHTGSITALAEPNTTAHLLNMLLTKGNTSGSNPYTHPFTVGQTEKYYTVDVKKGRYIQRFIGVKANSLNYTQQDNVIYWEMGLTGLKSFMVAKAASVSGTGPYTVTLKTDYDPSPTDGLTTSDTLIWWDGSAEVEVTIASIVDGVSFTTSVDVSALSADDEFYLKAQTPSFTLLSPFLWSKTEFRFGATASAAASADHTPLDQGSVFTLTHNNEDDNGAMTSGSLDPSDLRRTTFIAGLHTDRVFLDISDYRRYVENEKRACVVKMFSGASNQYSFTLTLNNIKSTNQPRDAAADAVVHVIDDFTPQYDSSDGQAVSVSVINALSSI